MRQLKGRQLDIAKGIARGITLDVAMEYRARWQAMGFELPDMEVTGRQRVSRSITSTIGTEVLSQAQKAIGRIDCSACRRSIKKLNRFHPESITVEALRPAFNELAGRADPEMVVQWFRNATGREWSSIEFQRRRRRRRNSRMLSSEKLPPMPFNGEPQASLLFHVWPNGDAWRWHVDKLKSIRHQFVRCIIGIATDHKTASDAEVRDAFGDGWEFVSVRNRRLREVETYQHMLQMLDTAPDSVTFCGHSKGTQNHTANAEPIRWWTEAMYQTVMQNCAEVFEAMADGAAFVGSFRRFGSMLKTRYRWHYSGTFYAFRNAVVLEDGVPRLTAKWWGVESWPGDHFPHEWAHCIIGDDSGDLYRPENQPREALEKWRARCGTVSA